MHTPGSHPWSNGRNEIVKLDHDTLELLAVHPVGSGLTLGAGVTLDGDGRLVFGTIFGKARILW